MRFLSGITLPGNDYCLGLNEETEIINAICVKCFYVIKLKQGFFGVQCLLHSEMYIVIFLHEHPYHQNAIQPIIYIYLE